MSVISETPAISRTSTVETAGGRSLLAGVAISSFAALLLELALTRLFSVVLFYHFAFLAISIALLGLGAGGVFAHLWKEWLGGSSTRGIAAAASATSAIVIPIVLEIVLHIPVSLELSWGNFLRLTAIYACSAIPFFLTGLQFSVVFARESSRIPTLYAADLSGGALACLGVVPLLNWIGGPNAVLFAALVSGIAAVLWSLTPRARRLSLGLSAVLALGIALNFSGRLADIVWAKGVRRQNVEFARWNAISRVEVDRDKTGARVIVIDADANTYIMNADLQHWEGSEWQDNLMEAPPAVVNALRPHGSYAIIGPGGGVDVLRAVANGSPSVTGIEINPIIANTIMRDRYADFAQHLYQMPQVHMHVGDGRSFVRNATEQYDVLQMTLVDTWASTAAGAFALSENSLYTTQAFRDYLSHLTDDGLLTFTRWGFDPPRESLRLVSLAIEALAGLGEHDPARHILVGRSGGKAELNGWGAQDTVIVSRKPLSGADAAKALAAFEAAHMTAVYVPGEPARNEFAQLLLAKDPLEYERNYQFDITPVSDNRPFFFYTVQRRDVARYLLQNGGRAADVKVNVAVSKLFSA